MRRRFPQIDRSILRRDPDYLTTNHLGTGSPADLSPQDHPVELVPRSEEIWEQVQVRDGLSEDEEDVESRLCGARPLSEKKRKSYLLPRCRKCGRFQLVPILLVLTSVVLCLPFGTPESTSTTVLDDKTCWDGYPSLYWVTLLDKQKGFTSSNLKWTFCKNEKTRLDPEYSPPLRRQWVVKTNITVTCLVVFER